MAEIHFSVTVWAGVMVFEGCWEACGIRVLFRAAPIFAIPSKSDARSE
jgi:hypothetical protein